jgi:hypothetical protein
MPYQAQDAQVQGRQLKVQRLVIPFTITHHATASLVVIAKDEPALLFLNTEGVDQITAVADGSPSFASPSDSAGTFNILVKVGESVAKVMQAQVIGRSAALVKNCTLANTTGLTAAGDKIVLNCTTAVNATTTDLNACLCIEYVIAE